MTGDHPEPEIRKIADDSSLSVSEAADPDPEPTFISYAQHGEDVVLWRALRHVSPGNYVDVGASDPTADSVTRALYERGWAGIDVEPTPTAAAALRAARPRDVVVECAAGAECGELTLFEVLGDGTGLSTGAPEHAQSAANRGYEVREITVPVRTLDEILEEFWPSDRPLHFLKIDVEGAEAAVLAGCDLERWRPWVVVIEATEPNSTKSTRDSFEGLLTQHGYRSTIFDGLNVFYVSPDHPELETDLSYPAGLPDNFLSNRLKTVMDRWDQAVVRAAEAAAAAAAADAAAAASDAAAAQWRDHWATASAHTVEAAAQARRQAKQLRAEVRREKRNKEAAEEALRQLQRTPIRRAKGAGRAALNRIRTRGPGTEEQAGTPTNAVKSGDVPQTHTLPVRPVSADPVEVLAARLRSVLNANDVRMEPSANLAHLLAASTDLLANSRDPRSLVWLLHVALVSRFPSAEEVQHFCALLALDGPTAVIDDLRRVGLAEKPTWATSAPIRILTGPVIDVSHTAYHNLHTGIQRVVREVVPRWLAEQDATLVTFDDRVPVYRSPSPLQERRVIAWDGPLVGPPEDPPSEILVPWQTTVVVPELAADKWRTGRLLALASASSCDVTFILFDLIPFTLPSACSEGMRHAFGDFVTVVRESKRVSTISRAVAADMTGFAVAFENQSITAPRIAAQPLPIEAYPAVREVVERLRPSVLGVPGLPLVLSVSSIEPRKNQLSILLAAEKLWSEGHQFQLLFIAGSGWERENFDNTLEKLQQRGRPVRVVSKASEEFLWSAYQLARFTVFVSITEGFGLPAAESIAAGTPVVLSSHGSMREIGEGGGAEFVNPHNLTDITDGMRRLLTDDDRLAELREQAKNRQLPTWDQYATDTWNWLVEGKQPS